jgi:hypothetical protein
MVATILILQMRIGLNVWVSSEYAPIHINPVEVHVIISASKQWREHRSRSQGPSREVELGRRGNRSRRAQCWRKGVRHMSQARASIEARRATPKV